MDVGGNPVKVPFMDDSSVVMTVVDATGVTPRQISDFQVFQNVPNPFSERTRLSYYTPEQERIELSIYNILGDLVYRESEWVNPGEHQFRFDGSELQPGTYLYRVSNIAGYFTGKLMKSR